MEICSHHKIRTTHLWKELLTSYPDIPGLVMQAQNAFYTEQNKNSGTIEEEISFWKSAVAKCLSSNTSPDPFVSAMESALDKRSKLCTTDVAREANVQDTINYWKSILRELTPTAVRDCKTLDMLDSVLKTKADKLVDHRGRALEVWEDANNFWMELLSKSPESPKLKDLVNEAGGMVRYLRQ
jgi:hypothetical protein